jgi:CBS domain-containing protein
MLEGRRRAMKASDIMQREVLATTPRASVRDIATQLVVNGISGMPVAERAGTVLGVITEADILESLMEGKKLEKLTAADIMSEEPITVDIETSVEEVIKILNEEGIVRVPVTEKGKLVGIISRIDVIRAVLEPEFITFGIS